MTIAPHVIRRYVIDRACGRMPRKEWEFCASDIGAWIRADETTARQHEHHRRVRTEGQPWCDVLGHRTAVRDDLALQVYFETIPHDDWPRVAIAVMRRPTRCLRDWRAAGARIIAAVDPGAGPSGTLGSGPLSGWPKARGTGARSMLPR